MKWVIVFVMMSQGQPDIWTIDAGPWATQQQCERWLARQTFPVVQVSYFCTKRGDQ